MYSRYKQCRYIQFLFCFFSNAGQETDEDGGKWEQKSSNQLQVSLIRLACHGGGAAAVSRRRPVRADAWGSQPRWEGTGWEGQWEREGDTESGWGNWEKQSETDRRGARKNAPRRLSFWRTHASKTCTRTRWSSKPTAFTVSLLAKDYIWGPEPNK